MSMNRSIEFVKINKSASVARSSETSAHPGERAVKNGLVDLTFKQKFGEVRLGGQVRLGAQDPPSHVRMLQGNKAGTRSVSGKCGNVTRGQSAGYTTQAFGRRGVFAALGFTR